MPADRLDDLPIKRLSVPEAALPTVSCAAKSEDGSFGPDDYRAREKVVQGSEEVAEPCSVGTILCVHCAASEMGPVSIRPLSVQRLIDLESGKANGSGVPNSRLNAIERH